MKRFGKKTAFGLTVAIALFTLGVLTVKNYLHALPPDQHAYSSSALQEHLRDGKTVLVTVDADWSIKQSDSAWFMSPDVSKIVRQKGFVTMTANWTTRSPEVDSLMAAIDRKEAPVLAVFSPANPDSPIVFNRGDTESKLLAALQSTPKQ